MITTYGLNDSGYQGKRVHPGEEGGGAQEGAVVCRQTVRIEADKASCLSLRLLYFNVVIGSHIAKTIGDNSAYGDI